MEHQKFDTITTYAPSWYSVEDAEKDERENDMPWPVSGDETAIMCASEWPIR